MGNYNITKLNQCLIENDVDENIRQKIMGSLENVRITDKPEITAGAFFNAMTAMDELLDEDTKKNIREGCACSLGGKNRKMWKEINKNFTTPEERIKAMNDTQPGGGIFRITGKGKYEVTFFDELSPYYKRCVCLGGRLHSINKKWSKTWCYCCGGQIKYVLETVLGKKVKVKILSTALTSMGKKSCRFELKEI